MMSISRKGTLAAYRSDGIINPYLDFSLSIMYHCATFDSGRLSYLPGVFRLVVIDAKMFPLMIFKDNV